MSRRPVNLARRFGEGANIPFTTSHSKSRSSPFLPIALVLVGGLLFIAYSFSGGLNSASHVVERVEGDLSCTSEVLRAVPILKTAYAESMRKVLHVGPETCSVVSKLLKEEDTEAWGVEPYELEDADGYCKSLIRKGVVRVADIKFPLPYRPRSFNLVIVSDALDYLSPKYLNKTLPELARVADGLVIFAGYPGKQRAKGGEPKFGRLIKMIKDKETGDSKGYAFITFKTRDFAQKAIGEFQNKEFKGRKLRCSLSQTKHRLFMGNIPKGWTEKEFKAVIEENGPGVETIDLVKDPQNPSRNRGFAFIEYYNNACADYARQKMSDPQFKLESSTPTVSWADSKTTTADPSAAAQMARRGRGGGHNHG